ncbi:MAG TPA: VOC family protein [Methylocella sp.]|nr:VOC family protein [Methylocella sp.]
MTDYLGRFVWYDVMTTNVEAAEIFYCGVLGWDAKDSGMIDRKYSLFSAGPAIVAGLMPIPKEGAARGLQPAWSGYIAVDDADIYAERVKAAGGTIHRPPEDIPGVGRFSVAADPHGAVFILFEPASDEPRPLAPAGTPGHLGWHELHAGNLEDAFAFYSGLFGWTKSDAIDMGPMGTYQLFAIHGSQAGGMMTKSPQTPAPFWLYYFNVDTVEAAMARATDGGGQIIHGPMQVPGGRWIAHCLDPQGAIFAVVGPKG